jgi:uncharacterized protein YyaL (SSP411 family)
MLRGSQLVMPAFTTVLRRLATLWESNREDLKAKVRVTLALLVSLRIVTGG